MSSLGVVAIGVTTEIPAPRDQAEARARMMMSRSALLASVATAQCCAQCCARSCPDWSERHGVGFYLGVGASSGDTRQLARLVSRSMNDGALDLTLLGTKGLRACSPLYSFELMNNFTLCHPAIQEGLTGPNAAFLSRGMGTALALDAAFTSEADRVLVGGVDTPDHPIAAAEARRAGAPIGEEAAVIFALSRSEAALARVFEPQFWALYTGPAPQLVLLAGDNDCLEECHRSWPEARIEHRPARRHNLAAGPALLWLEAVGQLAQYQRVTTIFQAVGETAFRVDWARP